MDHRHRVYYLVNLNQNRKIGGWGYKGWDNYGIRYKHNLSELQHSINSLKIRSRSYDYHYTENYQLMVSCTKEEESKLVKCLYRLPDTNYIKIAQSNKGDMLIMANAKKCDRCGKFYEKNHETGYKREIVVGVCFINTEDNSIEDRDLCDECIVKFKRFMAGCELKEN